MEPSDYYNGFLKLERGKETAQAWQKYLANEDIQPAIEQMEEFLSLDLSEAIEWFSKKKNKYDPTDILSKPIKFPEFKQRLGNFLLFKSFETNKALNVKEYIKLKRPKESKSEIPSVDYRSWMAPLLQVKDVNRVFLTYSEKGWIDARNIKLSLKALLSLCNLTVPESHQKHFYEIVDSLVGDAKVSFKEYLKSIEEWANSHPDILDNYRNTIELTIAEFKILEQSLSKGFLKISNELIEELEYFALLKTSKNTKEVKIEEKQRKGIEEIFNFYGRALKTFGKAPTFDRIEASNNTWNFSKFYKFCVDFELLTNEKLLSKDTLMLIFKKTATSGTHMTLEQFIDALDKIAANFFNLTYDSLNNTDHFHKPVLEKRHLLYTKLKLDRPGYYIKKMKGFGSEFGQSASRITSDDPGKKYVFKIHNNSNQKMYLKSPVKQPIEHQKPMHKKQSESTSVVPKRIPRREYAAKGFYSNSYRREQRSVSNEVQPVSLKDLNSMQYKGSLNELIGRDETTDWYLEQLYSGKEDLSYVLKMQDAVVSRGLRAAEKNRYLKK